MRLTALIISCVALLSQAPLHAQASDIGNSTNLWVSGGLASGNIGGNIYVIGSAWASAGPLVAGVRKMASGPYDRGSSHLREDAQLIGLRTTHRRFIALGALGRANLRHRTICNYECNYRTDWASQGGLAYSFQLLINYQVIGIGFEKHGIRQSNSHPHHYSAKAISVQVGWFGQ